MLQKILSFKASMAFAFISCAPVAIAVNEEPPVDVQELFTSTKPIYGESFTSPEGKGEIPLYKVDIQPGGVVPLHSPEAPLTRYVEEG